MRILLLTQWFQPEPFFKGLPFAKALRDRGHDVEVLTGFPNYPGGKLYPPYRIRFYQREVMDGIRINRVALYPSHDKSAVHRILNYISFSLSALLFGLWTVKKPDVVYVYNLVTLGLPAFVLRFLSGAKVIIDVQDLWPESVTSSKMLKNRAILWSLDRISNWVYREADALVVLSPGFKKELMRRGVTAEKIEVVYNWCDESCISKEVTRSVPPEMRDKFVVLFAGSMGTAQGIGTVLKCAQLCKNALPNVQFILIGGGVDRARLEEQAVKMGLVNVKFLPPRPLESMGEVFAMADVLLVHLKDDPLFRITIPSKTQTYLYIGKPIIMAVRGDAANLVSQAGAGIFCEPGNPGEMASVIKILHDMPTSERQRIGEAGHQYYMECLSFDYGVSKLEAVMRNHYGKKRINPVIYTE